MTTNCPFTTHISSLRKSFLVFIITNPILQSAKIVLLPPKYEIIMVPREWCHPIIHFSNIAIAILDFSLLLLVKLSLLILFAAFLVSVLCFYFDGSLSKVIALDSCRSFSLLKAIAKRLPLHSLTPLRVTTTYCCCNSWKSDNYMGSNTEKKP